MKIERRLRAGRAAVLGDPTQVHQVLMNLATNAVQAMPSGGTLRVSLEGARLDGARVATVGALGAGDYVVLEVADSGTGMSPEVLERIFDPFFTTKDVGVGTGLGLSLVHGIVTQLGGAIEVASTIGEGSVFTVYLPRAGDAADDRQRKEPEAPRGNRQQVLIVDDEEAARPARHRDPRGAGLLARRVHLQRRRARGLPRRSGAVRCGDHRRAHARHVGFEADPRDPRDPARRSRSYS